MNRSLKREIPIILNRLPAQTKQALLVDFAPPPVFVTELTAWEFTAKCWHPVSTALPVTVGRNGFIPAEAKVEGDGCTPIGVYALGLAFGSEPSVGTAMPYRQIIADDYWIDDPASPEYNHWVRGQTPAGSCERMLRADGLYRYGIVVEYNTAPVVVGKGSAIFVHLWRGSGEPTAGCVAMAEDNLRQLLAWLEPRQQPLIILGHRG